jgi:hypothetical protein
LYTVHGEKKIQKISLFVFDGVLLLRLQKIYKHPDDVDLFPGLLSETRLPGAVTGPTLSCLIGLQFSHIRQADTTSYSKN